MARFEFNVKIDAESSEEASQKVDGALRIMKASCTVIPANEFLKFAKKIEQSPEKIKLALKFI